jgi:hypothetical protein
MAALRLILLAALLAAGAPAARADEPVFLGGFDDLPLMAGLVEIDGAGVVFDTPQGRIVERYAAGVVAAEEVARFYQATLPALGWQAAGPLGFRREGELLSITLYPPEASGRITVRFSLAPG